MARKRSKTGRFLKHKTKASAKKSRRRRRRRS